MLCRVWVLLCISFSFAQTEIDLGFSQYNQLKVNKKKTTQNILWLSIITVLPLLNLVRLSDSPGFSDEIYLSTAIFSLPAILGWPLFIREYKRYERRQTSLQKRSALLFPKSNSPWQQQRFPNQIVIERQRDD